MENDDRSALSKGVKQDLVGLLCAGKAIDSMRFSAGLWTTVASLITFEVWRMGSFHTLLSLARHVAKGQFPELLDQDLVPLTIGLHHQITLGFVQVTQSDPQTGWWDDPLHALGPLNGTDTFSVEIFLYSYR